MSLAENGVNSAQIQGVNSRKGFVLLISGPSGAGKSTLLAILSLQLSIIHARHALREIAR